MGRKRGDPADSDLRRRAEETLAAEGETAAPAGRDPLALIHELQVHQIELEMQNEELRRAQAEAEELREKYQDLYEFAPVGYVTLDAQGKVLDANLAGTSLLGCQRRELLKRPLARLFHEESSVDLERFKRRVSAGSARERCEARLGGDKGTWLLLEGVAIRVGAEEGKTLRVALVDITERKEAEEQIRLLNDTLAARAVELEEANGALEAFAYTVTHDLRRPLTRVYSAAQLLEELGKQASEESQRVLSIITSGCRDMEAMINGIFNLSRSSSAPLKRRTTDLSRMALNIAAGLKLTDTARKVDFIMPEEILADCDPDLMLIVLDNLLGNAWKFTSNRDEAVIEFGASRHGGTTEYFVRDNGVGFPPEEAPALFQPFRRVGDENEFTGHGIGLATVRRIIERHGGSIRAEGTPGAGATFFFTLPEGK